MRLLGKETHGGVTDYYWLHTGDDGDDRITVETVEDAEPVFAAVRRQAQGQKSRDFHYKASIPGTVIGEICRLSAPQWGVSTNEVFRELMTNKTDRAQKVWRMLTEGRDYNKLQAKTYGT